MSKKEKKLIELGIKIGTIKEGLNWNDIVKAIRDNDVTYSNIFATLKPLYDEYGYEMINEVIIELSEPKVEKRPNVNKEVETR